MQKNFFLWFVFFGGSTCYILRNDVNVPILNAKTHTHATDVISDKKIDVLACLNPRLKDSQSTPILILRNANFWRKDRQILADINLQVNPGDRIGVVGNNGAGKSTLIKLINSCVKNESISDSLVTCDQTIYRGLKAQEEQETDEDGQFEITLGIWLLLQIDKLSSMSKKDAIIDSLDNMDAYGFHEFHSSFISKLGNTLSLTSNTIGQGSLVYMHQDFSSELLMNNTLVAEIARFIKPIFVKDRFIRFVDDNIEILQEIADEKKYMDYAKNLLNIYSHHSASINRQFIECRTRADKLLKIFDLDAYKNIQVGNLSSGLIVRSYILLSLLQGPELMLLDEPTNNLDVNNSAFLAEALREVVDSNKTSVIAVSHDEIFLNRFSNIIWECPGDGSVEVNKGNYDKFILTKQDKFKRIELRKKRLTTLVNKLQIKREGFVSFKRTNLKGENKRISEKLSKYSKEMDELRMSKGPLTLSKYSQSYSQSVLGESKPDPLFNIKRFKSLDNNELFSKGIYCRFVSGPLLEMRDYSISRPSGEHIISNYSFDIKGKSNVAIMGRNGVGKSTLLKSIIGQLDKDLTVSGVVNRAKRNVHINYFPQLPLKIFNTSKSVYKFLLGVAGGETTLSGSLYYSLENQHEELLRSSSPEGDLKQIMASFHIDDSVAQSALSKCSSGELARVTLSLLFMRNCHLLLLDEPTNHLDCYIKSYLAFLLNDIFQGQFVIVTHDEDFLKELRIHSVLYLFDKDTLYNIEKGSDFIKDYYASVHDEDFNLEEFLKLYGKVSKKVGSDIKYDSNGERMADVLEKEQIAKEKEKERETRRKISFGGKNVSRGPKMKNLNRWK